MRSTSRAVVVLGVLLAGPWPCSAQTATATAPESVLAPPEMEAFLMNASIVSKKEKSKGVTDAQRVVLSDGRMTHDAQVQDVYIEKAFFDVGPKNSEVNFKDLYRYNIAAYKLSLLLGLDNVPMSVERIVEGKPVAMTWWIDHVAMNENERQKKRALGPNPARTYSYVHTMYVFDELIQNRDRNGGNLLWTADWKAWFIDHTRAFRLNKQLQRPQLVERCDRTMFNGMRALTEATVTEAVGKSLTKGEIEALLARRDAILKLLDERIAQKTENAVLFDLR